jgi:hypothetical protein
VTASVEQDVGDRVSDLAGSSQHVDVAAVGEHAADAPEDAVHRSRETGSYRLEATREILRAGRFDDGVDVIALNRVVGQPEPVTLAHLAPAPLELGHESPRSQSGNVALDLERDVTRMPRRQRHSPTVRVAPLRPGLAARAGTRASPTFRRREVETELAGS